MTAGGDRFQNQSVVLPVMLDMLHLGAFGHGNGKAVVPGFEDGHDEGKERTGALPRRSNTGFSR